MKLESSTERKEAKESHATSFSMFDVFYGNRMKCEHILSITRMAFSTVD